MSSTFYITTAIPYVNANPHIGFALELVQTDVMARLKRLQGADTFFLTGSDDNSLKNVQAAEAAGQSTEEFVNQNAAVFEKLADRLSISNDHFIRTAQPDHFTGAQKFWSACKQEDIYKKKYKGLYCVGCEVFYTEDELVDGKCPEHDRAPELVEEENYFFKLSNYQKQLEELISSDTYKIYPESRKNEVLSFIRMGLQDFSISRSVERAKGWGVPVPGDDTQIMYVWFDALSNYITGLGYGGDEKLLSKYWPADVHVVGKGIIRFHAIYWPAMLLSAGVPLPKELFVHGYINIDGAKISKSTGNTVDPFLLIDNYGAEAVRYYLLRHVHPVEDSDFTMEKFETAYNADLANGLGNLVSRVTNMIEKYFQGNLGITFEEDAAFQKRVHDFLGVWEYRAALIAIWEKIAESDQLVDKEKPWKLAQSDTDRLKNILSTLAQNIYTIARALRPCLPETAQKVEGIITAQPIVKAKPLFAKLDT